MNNMQSGLFLRHKLNPLLTAADWPYPVNTVFNPAATLLSDGSTRESPGFPDPCDHGPL